MGSKYKDYYLTKTFDNCNAVSTISMALSNESEAAA